MDTEIGINTAIISNSAGEENKTAKAECPSAT